MKRASGSQPWRKLHQLPNVSLGEVLHLVGPKTTFALFYPGLSNGMLLVILFLNAE